MEKNILLTSLGHVDPDRLNHRYFYYGNGNGRRFCDSITIPEAGAKLILSRVKIDEIIVLGSEDTFDSESDRKAQEIAAVSDYDDIDINTMSEYGFFRYRISQYRDGIDLESLDVRQSIPEDREKALQAIADKGYEIIISDSENYRDFDRLLEGLSYEEVRWIKSYIYKSIDESRKIRILEDNKEITVRFVPTERDKHERLTNINELIDFISGAEDDVNLYMDMQGMESADAYTLISLAMLLNNAPPHSLNLKQLITTHYDPRGFVNPIDDRDSDRYQVSRFAEGINAFIQYGKVQMIRDYWISRNIRNERIESMLRGMAYIDCGISLCNIDNLETGIRILRQVFGTEDTGGEVPNLVASLFRALEKTIRADYGNLLEGERIKMYELARWALRKGFYQQALTIIESRFPTDMVYYGIFFYAEDEESKQNMLRSLQQCFIHTHPFQRWGFKDIDHYFIKYYFKDSVNHIRDKERAIPTYIQYRLDCLTQKDPKQNHNMQKAFSLLDDKTELLRQVLLGYNNMADLRNRLNHSEDLDSDKKDESDYDEVKNNIRIINTLVEQVDAYLDIFKKAMDAVLSRAEKKGRPEIVIITADEFKEYSQEETRRWKEKRSNRKAERYRY